MPGGHACWGVSVKVYHCVNGNRLFDGQIRFCTHFARQMVRLHSHNVNLTNTMTETDTVSVNRP